MSASAGCTAGAFNHPARHLSRAALVHHRPALQAALVRQQEREVERVRREIAVDQVGWLRGTPTTLS